MLTKMMKLKSKIQKRNGFTLIELIIVIAIIAILAAVLFPRFTGFQQKARRTQVVTDAKQLATAVDSLIAEQASGSLDATHGLEAATSDAAAIAANEAVVLANITATHIASLTVEADGGFTFTSAINGTTYTATRTASGEAPTVTP